MPFYYTVTEGWQNFYGKAYSKSINCTEKKDGDVEPCNTCSNCNSIQLGRHVDVIEMDGASKTGVNDIKK